MRYLIACGSGMIGTALTRRLVAKGHTVTILSRNPAAHSAPTGVTLVQWDGKSATGWGQLLNVTDAVVNLGGVNLGGGLWTKKRRKQLISSRLDSGKALVDAFTVAEHKPEVLLQASASGYYRPAGDVILEESSTPGTDFQGDLVQRWEESTRAVEALGVRRVVSRSAPVLVRGGLILTMFLLPFRMFVGGPLGGGRQYLSWIHIHDEVEGLLFLLTNKNCSGAYNLMSPQPVTNAEFGRAISRVLKRPYWFPVPAFALKLVLGEMSSVVLESWRGVPSRLSAAGFSFKFADPEAALRDLVGRKRS
ncbi:MAG TPA: TIGR01777 family oxidoreductase [Bellilinea sp.]|nr:TIGR01777 family oxidoreductase [Bellilinea sp.]